MGGGGGGVLETPKIVKFDIFDITTAFRLISLAKLAK